MPDQYIATTERMCSIDGCDKKWYCRNMCQKHYYLWHKNADPSELRGYSRGPKEPCSTEDCEKSVYCKGMCEKHYRKAQNPRCAVEGCKNPLKAKGWCMTHYMRWHRYGDPDHALLTFDQRFWSKVDLVTGPKVEGMPSRCWIWTGARNHAGYGHMGVDGRNQGAHRVSYELNVGPIPDGLHIDHLCCTPACVNPLHLEPVTNQENTLRGMRRRQRQSESGPKI